MTATAAISSTHPTWMEIDTSALASNLAEIRRRVGLGVQVIASVKANAYGHGIIPVARALEASGVEMLATGSFAEAKAVFTGDMLFAGGCGRLFEGNAQMMFDALVGKLARLPDDTRVYCGHEYTEGNLRFALTVEPENVEIQARLEQVRALRAGAAADWHDATAAEMTIPSTIGLEKATNPFMRAPDAQELGRIRELKDNF